MAGHIAESKAIDWRTPSHIIEAVRVFYGGAIDLDPCANANPEFQIAKSNFYLPDFDGLSEDWTGKVYCNPPYGTSWVRGAEILTPKQFKDAGKPEGFRKQTIAHWIDKAASSMSQGTETVMLIPAAVDTKHWQDTIFKKATSVVFLRGRLRFVGAKAHAPMACALVYFGINPDFFDFCFGDLDFVFSINLY